MLWSMSSRICRLIHLQGLGQVNEAGFEGEDAWPARTRIWHAAATRSRDGTNQWRSEAKNANSAATTHKPIRMAKTISIALQLKSIPRISQNET
jgi:hypothetical protein